VHELAKEMRVELSIDNFRSARALYDAARRTPYRLVFLETEIGGISGIELARRIRFHSKETAFIFVTAKEEYALAAYSVFATGYILKRVTRARLYEPFAHVFKSEKPTRPLLFRTAEGGEILIAKDDLVYIEVFGNELVFHCKSESVRGTGSLSGVMEVLPENQFYRSHRNFIVNLQYVQKIERYFFGMQNGEKVTVAKNRFTEARDVFEKYLSE
jgi:DNA-binding LytR/AlgR family response regulator